MLWPTCLRHENGSVRPVRYHTLTEYRHEVSASAVPFYSSVLKLETSRHCSVNKAFVWLMRCRFNWTSGEAYGGRPPGLRVTAPIVLLNSTGVILLRLGSGIIRREVLK
ncbi:hypothetical protein EVAR_99911_1 [Eumeta japonica]|uniref:Uncharacterized protein n=1 Tax=Eumeta variegata TaxID=151549 RepID=A0A4C2A6Q6_EUMVA|nr:hypothetical protein EVAR_99911_1 [Eumeta japonica]